MEESKNLNWKPTDKRFVAFIDILGFKDLVMRSSHADIYSLLSKLSNHKDTIARIQESKQFSEMYEDVGIYTVSFSDSIALFSKNDSADNFDFFTYSTGWLFARAIENSIPLKGAIAYGEISINKTNQIYFGQAIIDAYLLEEELNYFGIIAHNSIDNFLNNLKEESEQRIRYVETSTPLKCGNISHLNLNWFDLLEAFEKNKNKDDIIAIINQFKTTVSGSPRRYVDNTITIINQIINSA